MAKHVGRNGVLKSGSTTIGNLRGWSFDTQLAIIDLTVMNDLFADQDTGLPSSNGQFNLLTDPSDAGQATLTAGAEFVLQMYIDGETSGDYYYEVTIAISGIGGTSSHDGAVETTVNWIARSLMTIETVA